MTELPTFDRISGRLKELLARHGGALLSGSIFALLWPVLIYGASGMAAPGEGDSTAQFLAFAFLFFGYFIVLFFLGFYYTRPAEVSGYGRAFLSGLVPVIPAILAGIAVQIYTFLTWDPFSSPGTPETGDFLLIFPMLFIYAPPIVGGLGGLVRKFITGKR